MKKGIIAKLIAASLIGILCTGTTACIKPYDKPEIVTIEASQTAFLIPLVGDSENQASFESERMLAEAKVAAKEVQIPHRWVQTGRMSHNGEWRPSAKLIIVERKPVTREWSSDSNNGTSNKNQAIFAESSESIGFSVSMNCTAQIYSEDNAVKFLYSYNNVGLDDVMDNEIRPKIETVWNELCTSLLMEEIRVSKADLMKQLRDTVIPYFEQRGITITTLGLKEGFTYENDSIQKAIDEQIIAEKGLVTAKNQAAVDKTEADTLAAVRIKQAESEAEAIRIKASAEAEANKMISESLTKELIESQKIEKWNGNVPVITGDSTPLVTMDMDDLIGSEE